MISKPTYQRGFYAPGKASRPLFPKLWKGCVGAWNMGLGPTGTTLRDHSGRRIHGTLTSMDANSDWVVVDGMYALDFDETDDYVTCPDNAALKIADRITNCAWVRMRSLPGAGANHSIINKGTVWSDGGHTILISTTGYVIIGFQGLSTASLTDNTTAIAIDTWTHIANRYDGSEITIWVNGKQVKSVSSTGSVTTNSSALWIGREQFSGGRWTFDGQIDDVRIYNRALSPNEIKLLSSRRGIAYEIAPYSLTAEQAAAAAVIVPYWHLNAGASC